MFEGLLLVSIVLIVISQLLPTAEIQSRARTTKISAGKQTRRSQSRQNPKTHSKKQQPCQKVSGRAAINTRSYLTILRF